MGYFEYVGVWFNCAFASFFLGANLQHKGSLSLSFSRAVAFSTATGNGEHAVKQRVELTVVLQTDYINETLAISGRWIDMGHLGCLVRWCDHLIFSDWWTDGTVNHRVRCSYTHLHELVWFLHAPANRISLLHRKTNTRACVPPKQCKATHSKHGAAKPMA